MSTSNLPNYKLNAPKHNITKLRSSCPFRKVKKNVAGC